MDKMRAHSLIFAICPISFFQEVPKWRWVNYWPFLPPMQWFVLLWPKLHSPNVLRAANDDDIRVMMIATSRVTLIVPACKPGWEEMENLRQSSYLSQISQIIFVEKNCHVEIFWKTLGLFGKFWENLGGFATIYALSCGEKLSPKSTYVEKKWQIWGLGT